MPEKLIASARSLMAVRRYADALPWLAKAIAADPEDMRPRCLLALSLYYLERWPEALTAADQAVAVAPEQEWPHRLRSLVLLATGRNPEALAAAQEAVRLGPTSAFALCVLALAQARVGNQQEAVATAERAVAVAPETAWTHETLGAMAMNLGKWDAAEASLRRALALDPQYYRAMNNLGVVLRERGQLQEAMERFHDAAKLNPQEREAKQNLSRAVQRYLRPNWPSRVSGPLARLGGTRVAGAIYPLWRWWRRRRLRRNIVEVLKYERLWTGSRDRAVHAGTSGQARVSRADLWVVGIIAGLVWALTPWVVTHLSNSLGEWALVVAVATGLFTFACWRAWNQHHAGRSREERAGKSDR